MSSRGKVAAVGVSLVAALGIGVIVGTQGSSAETSSVPSSTGAGNAVERTMNRQGTVTRQQAARIADRTIERRTGKAARVTWIGPEDDFGARWEVEVTLSNGREFDVLVNSKGRVVRVVNKG